MLGYSCAVTCGMDKQIWPRAMHISSQYKIHACGRIWLHVTIVFFFVILILININGTKNTKDHQTIPSYLFQQCKLSHSRTTQHIHAFTGLHQQMKGKQQAVSLIYSFSTILYVHSPEISIILASYPSTYLNRDIKICTYIVNRRIWFHVIIVFFFSWITPLLNQGQQHMDW